MSTDAASVQTNGSGDAIAPGTVVGGRIKVERTVSVSSFGALLFARDGKTRKSIALRILSPQFVENEEQFSEIRTEIKQAARLKHRNIVATFGVGTYGPHHFTACEWVEGSTLSDFVESRRKADQIVSVRGAYNVVTHVCKALSKAHDTVYHGALRPSSVWIAKSGRVKVGDFGIGRALVTSGKWKLLEEQEQAFLAPEIKAGGQADTRSDIFGIGALLYVLLTGRSPIEEFIQPSAAHPDATPEIDAILMKCLAADPAARFATPEDVSQTLLPLVADSPTPTTEDEFGVDVEIDVDIAASLAPPPQQGADNQPAAAARPVPVVLKGPPQEKRPPPPSPISSPNLPAVTPPEAGQQPSAEPQARQSEVDLDNLLKKITENDAPRWMVVKDKLDHGPFSGRELVQLIVKGEVLEDHALLNMDTGERKKVREFSEFVEFLEQYKIRKSEEEFQEALERTSKAEKRSNVTKFLVLAGVVGVLAMAGGGYLITREALKEEKADEVDLATLFETGQVKITGTAGILKYRKRRGRGGRSSGRPSGAGGFLSYEDAMNQPVELGDVSSGGGERQLTSHDVAGVMNRRLNSLFGCVGKELRRGGRLGTVRIDLAIAGSGRVQGVSVHSGSGSFKGCIVGKVKKIRFPRFPAPRMGARYSFDVN